jgi:hypothetical protein
MVLKIDQPLLRSHKDLDRDLLPLGCQVIPRFQIARKLERVIFLQRHEDLQLHQKPMSGRPPSITHMDHFFQPVD